MRPRNVSYDQGDKGARGAARSFAQAVVSFAGGAGIAMLVPFVILAVGLPLTLAIRGFIALAQWLGAVMP